MRDRPFESLSGPWTGWSIQDGFRLSERMSLTISRAEDASDHRRDFASETAPTFSTTDTVILIRGWGTDSDGDFSMDGYYVPLNSEVHIVRRYIRAPKNPAQVGYPFFYEGRWNGYCIHGTWRASTEPDNNGPFEMWPESEDEIDDFMFEEVFKSETLPSLAKV